MRAPARFGKHPFHPLLVALPIGLFIAAFVFELLHLWNGNARWSELTFYNMAGGILGAVAASIPGFIDYVSLKDERILPVAHRHFGVNVALLATYSANLWLRTESGKAFIGEFTVAPFLLSIVGLLLLILSGWLGGELVFAHGVAVDVKEDPISNSQPN